jgi:acyl carrier protein
MDTVDEFTVKFHDQFFDADTFDMQPDTEFRQINSWDSLTGMAVLVMIKDNYGVDIPVGTFTEMKTVREVFDHIIAVSKK